ncbi:MAG: tRNA pseudouridine(38-40) synthase TruA [Myxococcota bacterium]
MSAPTATYSVLIRYQGDGFHGVALQPGLRTVGQVLKDAVVAATGLEPVAMAFAARTDARVHARAQVASFRLTPAPSPESLRDALARTLPADLRVLAVEQRSRSFHARASASGKHYRYRILAGVDGEATPHAWCVKPHLDVARMREAAQEMEGTHDFTALRHPRCSARNPVRTVTAVRVRERRLRSGAQYFVVDVRGEGFLRQMVRIMAGTMGMVGAGWLSPQDVAEALSRRDRGATGPAAPAHGLTLWKVELAREEAAAGWGGAASGHPVPR